MRICERMRTPYLLVTDKYNNDQIFFKLYAFYSMVLLNYKVTTPRNYSTTSSILL